MAKAPCFSRNFGTWTLLGGFATDLELEPDESYKGPPVAHVPLLDACPTKAIIAPQTVDARRCIATWTIERTLHPEAITKAPRDHSWAFGCDICQEVCPWNKFQQVTLKSAFNQFLARNTNSETFKQDLRGSPLYRTKKVGLLANFLRIRKSLEEQNLRNIYGQEGEGATCCKASLTQEPVPAEREVDHQD